MTTSVSIYFDGSTATDVTDAVRGVNVRRGRSRELDTFTSGSCTIRLQNRDRAFDPLYADGPYYGLIRPRLRVSVISDGVSIFDGFVEDWNYDYDVSTQSETTVACIDGLALLSQTTLDTYTNTQDTPGARIANVIARPEVSYPGATDLDPGFNTLQADTVPQDANTLSYLQTVAETDLGRLFVDGSGTLRFRDRTSGILATPRVIFANPDDSYISTLGLLFSSTLWLDAEFPTGGPDPWYTDTELVPQLLLQQAALWLDADDPAYIPMLVPFNGVALEYGSEFLYNRISVTREGGTPQTADNTASQATYGIRTLARTGLLFSADSEAEQYADYLATLYGTPQVRIAGHEVLLDGLEDYQAGYVRLLEIGDVVRTIWAPNGISDHIDQKSIVEGVEHIIDLDRHTVRLQLTPYSDSGFVLDSTTDGLLDTSEVTY